jgi:hypothetical protein
MEYWNVGIMENWVGKGFKSNFNINDQIHGTHHSTIALKLHFVPMFPLFHL